MANLDARGMQDITSYAPARIMALGLVQAIFGALIVLMGALTIWATSAGEMKPAKPGDMPAWWMMLVGAALGFMGFCFVSSALGRIISAFAGNCYFKAGPDGIAICLPVQGWFGRFRKVEYDYRWDEIKQLLHFTHRINLIPVAKELQIKLRTGKTVSIPRHYFSASAKSIQQRLLTIRAIAGK